MQLHILYFARLRDTFGRAEEHLEFSGTTIGALIDLLVARGDDWHEALGGGRPFRVARNQAIATVDTVLSEGDEIAIFPPVTGG